MKIVFYTDHPYWGQLNNTGGCKTIIRSCQVLRELGHTCNIVCRKDKFTWFPHPKPIKKIPKDTDVAIACSVSDVGKMLKKVPGGTRPLWWMRGIETWAMSPKKIIKTARKLRVMVNAEHLKDWLARFCVPSHLVYAGLDFVGHNKNNEAHHSTKRCVGFLKHDRHPTKNSKMANKIAKLSGMPYTYLSNRDNKSPQQMERLYEKCDVWIATSELEGFHQVPAEAALCGCVIVGYQSPHNGTSDYLNRYTGYPFTSVKDAVAIIKNMDTTDAEKKMELMLERLFTKIGTRERCMTKMIGVLS